MAGDTPTPEEQQPDEVPAEEQLEAGAEGAGEAEAPAEPAAEAEAPTEPAAEAEAPAEPAAEAEAPAEPAAEAEAPAEPAAEEAPAAPAAPVAEDGEDEEPEAPRVKPAIPGADLEVDLVLEGEDRRENEYGGYSEDGDDDSAGEEGEEDFADQPVAATIDLAADARYKATGKRKTAVARVVLKPGTGAYIINGKSLDEFFPRPTLQRQIRQPLEAVGYEERMDVVARMHGGGVSAQAGALRHGISRALLDADPNLRGELKRRGFLTRDARVKERKKAGLKKARKRPQFSKR
jgi:small subunit ribosomal protein S9